MEGEQHRAGQVGLPQRHVLRGQFANNKPNGKGQWVFKNGNTLDGEYVQKPKDTEDEEAADDLPDGEVPKPKFTLQLNSYTGIANAAHLVNSVEQWLIIEKT